MSGALMRRWSFGICADHTDRTRREESPRRFFPLRWASLIGRRSETAQRVARSRRPRPSSTGTAREGGAQQGRWTASQNADRDAAAIGTTRRSAPKTGASVYIQYTSVPSNENAPVFVARLAVPLNRAEPDAAEKRPVPPTNVIVPENATCADPTPGITSPIVV